MGLLNLFKKKPGKCPDTKLTANYYSDAQTQQKSFSNENLIDWVEELISMNQDALYNEGPFPKNGLMIHDSAAKKNVNTSLFDK